MEEGMRVSIDIKDLKNLINEAVREVLEEEKIKFFLASLPEVSQEEMRDIEETHGTPGNEKSVYGEEIEV